MTPSTESSRPSSRIPRSGGAPRSLPPARQWRPPGGAASRAWTPPGRRLRELGRLASRSRGRRRRGRSGRSSCGGPHRAPSPRCPTASAPTRVTTPSRGAGTGRLDRSPLERGGIGVAALRDGSSARRRRARCRPRPQLLRVAGPPPRRSRDPSTREAGRRRRARARRSRPARRRAPCLVPPPPRARSPTARPSGWSMSVRRHVTSRPGADADLAHLLGEHARLVERLHERPVPDLDVEHDRLGAARELLRHDRARDQGNDVHSRRDVAERIELLVGGDEVGGLPDPNRGRPLKHPDRFLP